MWSDEARRMGNDAESHTGVVEVPANVMEDIHLGLGREQVWSITKTRLKSALRADRVPLRVDF